MNFLKLYIGDYERDTGHLTLTQHGALFGLLRTYYAKEGPLPNDLPTLYRIARAFDSAEQKAVRSVVQEFFREGQDGMLHNKRADEQIADDQRRIEVAKENGRRGGRPRSSRPMNNPVGIEFD